MKGKLFLFFACLTIVLALPAHAALVSVDLSGATTGTYISGIGASFATAFQGQAYNNLYNLSGSPSSPLTLQAHRTLDIAYWSVSNSILPEPDNQGPLSMLLGSSADSITWTMGSASPPSSVTIDFFAANGSLVHHTVQGLISGYNVYSFSGFGTFAGLSIYDDNDSAGLRFQNFSYNSVPSVPLPSALLLLGPGLAGLAAIKRRFTK